METTKAIYFDMDGTIANLYGVPNWLPKLHACDPSPYTQAVPMCDLRLTARYLNQLQREGYILGVVSWLAKEAPSIYDEAVRLRKMRWLANHLQSVQWNEIHLVKYGTPKHLTARTKRGIIFDDNVEVRERWLQHGGQAFDEKNINQRLGQTHQYYAFAFQFFCHFRSWFIAFVFYRNQS